MAANRCGEQGDPPFRSKRLYFSQGSWYFDTREGLQFGPFTSQRDARTSLAMFMAVTIREACANGSTADIDRPGRDERIEHMVEELLRFLDCREDLGPLAARAWAKTRIDQIARHCADNPDELECIGALEYAIARPSQFFDIGRMLKKRA
jgi:hypothetical protein